MRNYIKRICCISLMSVISVGVMAQGIRSAYFLDSFHYRHQLNPAMSGGQNYFSFPGLGNVNVEVCGNVGISNFLYPIKDVNGNMVLTSFMSREVDSRVFINGLEEKIRIGGSADLMVFSSGFKSWGGFSTIDIGLHSRAAINLPRELFEFMKEEDYGTGVKTYKLRDMRATSNNYMDISLGHSHQINDRLRVGGKVKFLLGLARADIAIEKMDIELSKDRWMVDTDGEINFSALGLAYKTSGNTEVEGLNLPSGKIILSSGGLAFDLGATYKLVDNLTFSASIVDFGFIKWNKTRSAKTKEDPYVFDGFEQIGVGTESLFPTIGDQFASLGDDLQDLIAVYDKGQKERLEMMSATLNVGLEYILPAYDKFSIGLLSSTNFDRLYTRTEGRLTANVSPVRWFDASLSGVFTTFGRGVGLLVNFHPKGFNLFLASDFMFNQVTPQFVPVGNCNMNLAAGINFPLSW